MERERLILQHNLFLPLFNELVIKNTPIKKIRPLFVLMEEVHLPQSQVSLRKGKTFH